MKEKNVSVIIPVYNEEKYIEGCIKSLFLQDYPLEKMEWIFVDGKSTDDTVNIIKNYKTKFPNLIKLFCNPNRTVPYAVNIGINNSIGEYIIRLDAHCEYNFDYITKCVYYLDNYDYWNVGGVANTKGKGFVGSGIAKALSCRFGVGNSQFRLNCNSAPVDTVPFGAFRKSTFDKIGLFDVMLARNEDNEINFRIRKNGGTVFLSNDIKFTYYCRDTIIGLMKQAYQNGTWNMISMKLCPGSMRVRHFIPFVFFLSLLFLIPLSFVHIFFFISFLIELTVYFLLDIYFSVKQSGKLKFLPLLLIVFPLFHLSYGFGSFVGIFKSFKFHKK